jgi:hypothetical protein
VSINWMGKDRIMQYAGFVENRKQQRLCSTS